MSPQLSSGWPASKHTRSRCTTFGFGDPRRRTAGEGDRSAFGRGWGRSTLSMRSPVWPIRGVGRRQVVAVER